MTVRTPVYLDNHASTAPDPAVRRSAASHCTSSGRLARCAQMAMAMQRQPEPPAPPLDSRPC